MHLHHCFHKIPLTTLMVNHSEEVVYSLHTLQCTIAIKRSFFFTLEMETKIIR